MIQAHWQAYMHVIINEIYLCQAFDWKLKSLTTHVSFRPCNIGPVQTKLNELTSHLCEPIQRGEKKMFDDDVQMRLRSLAFIGFQWYPILFMVNMIKRNIMGFTLKIHFPLSKSTASNVKIGPLRKKYLVP